MDAKTQMRLAVFIDGENIAAELFDQVSARAEVLGRCVSWRVFGDFTENGHSQWLDTCRTHGIQPDLVLPSVSRKNSTDICMVIAAMDLLASQTVDALLLVSDDRDFLPLVRRLRAGGMKVHGFGNKTEGVDLSRFHSSWTQAEAKAVGKIVVQNHQTNGSAAETKDAHLPPTIPVTTPVNADAAEQSPKIANGHAEFAKLEAPQVKPQIPAVAILKPLSPTPVPKVAAHKIEAHNAAPAAKASPQPKPAPAVKPVAATPASQPHPLAAEFSRTVQAKLAAGGLTLSLLGTWIRQDHPKLTPLLGPGKLKKRLGADNQFKISGNSVSLAK